MYKVNEKYYEKIYDNNAKHNLRIAIDGVPIETRYVKSISYEDECFDSDDFTLGSACYGAITITIDKQALIGVLYPKEFYFEYSIPIDEETTQIVPIGYFYSHPEDTDTSNDYAVKFVLKDVLYDMDNGFTDFSDKISEGNFTRGDLAKLICDKYNLELATPEFINHDKLVGVYDNTLSDRSWLVFISERAGGFAKVVRDKKLYIKSLNDVDTVEINTNKISQFTNGDLKTITGVTFQNATQKYTFGDASSVMIYLSQDNYFSCTEDEVEKIYNALNGLQFQKLDIKMWGDPSIDTGDLIKVNNFVTFCQKHWEYKNGFIGSYKSVLNIIDKGNLVIKTSSLQRQRLLQSQINELDGTITILNKQVDDNTETLNLTINSLHDIQNIFQITGGNNLIKNSVGLFGNEFWNVPEGANVSFGEDTNLIGKTTSCSKITLQNTTISTSSDNIINLSLNLSKTFCFKIKQDEDVETSILIYGRSKDNPYYAKTLTGTYDWEEIYVPEENIFSVTDSNLTLEITSTSTYEGKAYISDLMLVDGEKRTWQPSSGEVWGTVIKMSQMGISCYSRAEGYVTLFTTQGVQIRELNGDNIGDIITKFDLYGISTGNLEQTGYHKIQKLITTKINSNNREVYCEYIQD